jgi:hypothetical protein
MSMTREEWERTLPERERENFERELLTGKVLSHYPGCNHQNAILAAKRSLASQGIHVVITQGPGWVNYELAHAKLARVLRGDGNAA